MEKPELLEYAQSEHKTERKKGLVLLGHEPETADAETSEKEYLVGMPE